MRAACGRVLLWWFCLPAAPLSPRGVSHPREESSTPAAPEISGERGSWWAPSDSVGQGRRSGSVRLLAAPRPEAFA